MSSQNVWPFEICTMPKALGIGDGVSKDTLNEKCNITLDARDHWETETPDLHTYLSGTGYGSANFGLSTHTKNH